MTARGMALLARLALAGALLALLPRAQPAYADTYTVTTTQDAPHALPIDGTCTSTLMGGTCTLRAAVQAANFLGGAHTINLQAAGTYLLTVTGAGEDLAATGDLDLNNVHVTIANTSAGSIVIDGNLSDRVFDVGPNAAASLSLSNVTIQNGMVPSGSNGGGVRLTGLSDLTLSQVAFNTNTASGGDGGAVNAASRQATLTNVSFTGNSAQNGGGLYAIGDNVTITHGSFTNNTASVDGAGIFASPTMSDVTFSGNQATRNGGGVFGGGAWTDVTITGNSAARGGGVHSGPATWNNVTITNNSATVDGGGYLSAWGGVITGGSISNNTAPNGIGGGISAQGGRALTLTNVAMNGNSAKGAGRSTVPARSPSMI